MNTPATSADSRAERLKRLSMLLDQALDLEDAARAVWLDGLDPAYADLGPTLREMLGQGASKETAELLERRPDFTAPRDVAEASELSAGDQIGPYSLLLELGRGGMGEVWLAERSDGQLKRQVALKLPILGVRRAVLVQRFARERDILAALAHPHIARLYDAGIADDGQPYLALEYVAGEPITRYCEHRQLDLRSRVRLMQQVMDAVQFAHTQLVIHRDLKPGNVLVTDQGQAMLLDFGIAKLLAQDSNEANDTELTRLGGRALTLDYAAPEQVAGTAVSTTTDVYALGVLLYELLGGTRPFSGSRHQVEQAVLTVPPPPLRALPADLATIVLKAMKKVPAERYATADALSADLGRWLRGEAVQAQPDSLWYRTRKFVARRRLPVAVGVVFTIALIGTGAVALWQAAQARQQASVARQEAQRAQAVQGFLLDLFNANRSTQADPQAAQSTTARELLDRGAARIDQALADQPQSRIEVLSSLADMYSQLGLERQAASLQARRLDLARRTWGAQDPRLAQLLLDQIETLQDSDRRSEIPALLDEALASLRQSPDAAPALQGDAMIVAARYWRYASLAKSRQGAELAATYLNQHLPQSNALVTAHLLASRAAISAGDAEAGETHARQAIAAAKLQGNGAAAWQATPTGALADALQQQLKFDAAEAAQREQVALTAHVHGDLHPDTLSARVRLGNLLLAVGRSAEGQSQHATVSQALGTIDPRYSAEWRSYIAGLMGSSLLDRGRPDDLAPLLRADLANLERTLPRSPVRAHRERALAEVLATQGDVAAARQTLAAAREHWAHFADGADAPRIESMFALSQARIELAAGNPAAALPLLAPGRPAMPVDDIARQVERAHAQFLLGRAADATASAAAALAMLEALPATSRPMALQASALEWRGMARRAMGDAAAARADLQQALSLRRSHDMPASIHVARIERELVTLSPLGLTGR